MKYSDRHRIFEHKVIISYPNAWGGQIPDRWMWMGELDGEVWDYDTKAHLIAKAIESGKEYIVLRVHKNGTVSQMAKTP